MFGKNKILKAENHDGNFLDVVEIFPTLQGEGPYVGYPAVFIRLAGCNLACEFCDTEFENFKKISLTEILDQVKKLAKNDEGNIVRNLVVITGGEPLRQPIEKLCKELVNSGFLVQIETNGTLFRELPKKVKIICSPKASKVSSLSKQLSKEVKYHAIRPDLLSRINAFKFIISASNKNYSEVCEVGQSKFNIPVYVQPMDEYNEVKNEQNLQYTIEICQKYGYLFSTQLHKALGLK